MCVAIGLAIEIGLDLVLEQAQIQFSQGVGTESTSIVTRVVVNQRNVLQLVGDPAEAAMLDTILAQSLEEKERFERGVGGWEGAH